MMNLRGFDVIYADAEEKYVKGVLLYGKASDDYLYKKAGEKEADRIDKDTLLELLKKGVVIFYENAYYTPLFYKENAGAVEVTIATAISSSASSAVVFYSKEHTDE